MKKKRRVFFQKAVSIVTGLFLVFQSLTPDFLISSRTFAQEEPIETPAPTIAPAPEQPNNEVTPTVTPEVASPTPNEEVVPTSTPIIEPTVIITPEPTQEISPTIEPQKEEPSNTPSDPPKEASPPVTPTPIETPTPSTTPEPTPEVIEQTCEAPSQTRTTSDYDWSINEFAGTAETRNNVELGVTYVFPKNTNVSITFTCLPKDVSKRTPLKIQEIAISELKLPDGITAATNYAYDITTGMQDGTFKYNVTLPKADNTTAEVSYIEKSIQEATTDEIKTEDIKQIEESKINQEGSKVKASDVDHFTIFIATYSDWDLEVEQTQYHRNEKVYTYAEGLTKNGSTYYRIDIINPEGTIVHSTSCSKNIDSLSDSYTLSSSAIIGLGWKAVLSQFSSSACSSPTNTLFDTFEVTATTNPTSLSNPTIENCCGLDIALIIDNSNSIDENELNQMKTALTGFVTALAGTPTQFSVTKFGTNATVIQNFTSDLSAVNNAINSISTYGGGTNWENAFNKTISTFDPRSDKPNLIIFTSDGNPTFPNCGGSSSCSDDVYAAIIEANHAKQIPARILAIGIGNDLNTNNLKAISGTVVNGSDISTTDVVTTDFSGMAAKLAAFAAKTCGGKISVNKYVDNVQTGGGQTWSFTIDGTTTITTDANGQVASGTLAAGNHSITEVSIPTGYSFDTANCTNGTLDKPNKSVKNIAITNDSIITCNFYNTANYTPTKICHATGNPNKWVEETPSTLGQLQGHVGSSHQNGNDIIPAIPVFLPLGQNWDATGQAIWNYGCAIPPAKGTLIVKKIVINDNGGTKNAADFSFRVNGGTAIAFEADGQNDLSLDPNTYSVAETPVAGYDITYSNCSGITLGAGETKTCTITNNDISPKITVTKIVSGSTEPITSFPLSVKNLTHTYPVNSGQQYTIDAGTWTVTETNKTGYTATITGDCAADGTIMLNPGNIKACTITNKRDTGVVTFEKLVDDGSSVLGWLFTVKDDTGATVGTYHDGDTATFPTGTYTVTESGATHYAFQGATGICTTNPTNGIISMGITKAGGTCTFTNVYVPYCGDGIKNQPSEQCDDGNSVNTDACTNACFSPTCGDGYIQTGVEECDNGANNDTSCTPPYGSSCSYCDAATCKPITITGPSCGDGIVNSANGEQCDDNNTTNGDGCSATCQEEPGSITFIKVANPHDAQTFHYTYETIAYPIGDFDLTDDDNGDTSNTTTFTALPTGSYRWRENAVSDWNIESIVCQESVKTDSIIDATHGRVTVTLEPGENVTCTYTNTKNGTAIIEKQTIPDGSSQIFKFDPSWSIGSFNLADGQQRLQSLPPGTYTVDELLPGGWTVSDITCDDKNSTSSATLAETTINIEAGETVKCIFTNTRDTGTIELKKAWEVTADQTTLNIGSATNGSDIATQLTGANGTDPLTTGTITVPTGMYYVSETGGLDTYSSDLSCLDNGEAIKPAAGNAIVVQKDHSIVCTYTNTRKTYPLFVTKFEDVNGNATQDAGEGALDGWTMQLYTNSDCAGSPSASVVTNSSTEPGTATFDALNLGQTYWVKEVESSTDWVNTTGNCVAATIHDDSKTNNTITFGNFMYGSLTGHKFEDVDNSHSFNTGEPYIPEWNMRVYKSNNDGGWNSIDAPSTNSDGIYTVSELGLGTYKICEVNKSGWQQTFPDSGVTRENSDEATYCHQFTISQSGQKIEKDFGNIHTGDMVVTKFEDLNGNGTWDKDTESALNNWEINVSGQKSQLTGSGDNNKGEAAFNRLVDGTYYVSETNQEGWKQTGIYCETSGIGTKITKQGEAYGHHGYCSGWNGCGDAKTCAQWACEINGYTTLVSYGADKQCTEFDNCHLFYSRGNIQWNWGNWCEVQGVTDIVCTGRSVTMHPSNSTIASTETESRSFLPIEKVSAQESEGYPVTVIAGGKTNCYIGNQYIPAKLEVSKVNNATTTLSPGSSVLYTLTVTSHDNASYGVKLTDLLPKGFVYRAGSWTASSNTHGALALSEPTYHSPGTWDIGTIEKDEVITLTLLADISTDEKPGTYKDLALAYGCQRNGDCELGDTNSMTASAVDPGQLDDMFVGTEVTVIKDQQDSKTLTVNREVTEEGSVLGATTELPSTGAHAQWILVALSFVATGIGFVIVSRKMRRYHA